MMRLYMRVKKLSDLPKKSESESLILFEWFRDNYLKANSGKSHVMLTTDNKPKINIKGSLITNEKIVNVTVDNKLFLSLILIWFVKKLTKNSMPLLEFQILFQRKS